MKKIHSLDIEMIQEKEGNRGLNTLLWWYPAIETDNEISKLTKRLETTQEQLEKFMNTNAQQTILIMKLRAQIEKLEEALEDKEE